MNYLNESGVRPLFWIVHHALNKYLIKYDGFDGVVQVVHRPGRRRGIVIVQVSKPKSFLAALTSSTVKVKAASHLAAAHSVDNGSFGL